MMDYMMDYSDISDTKVIKSPLYCTQKKKKKHTHTHTHPQRSVYKVSSDELYKQ